EMVRGSITSIAVTRLAACLLMPLVLTACAALTPTTPIPGASRYCFGNHGPQEMYRQIDKSTVEYGPFKRYTIGGGWICGIDRFYVLKVKWQNKDGTQEDLQFDLPAIVSAYVERTPAIRRPFRPYGQPDLEVLYFPDR